MTGPRILLVDGDPAVRASVEFRLDVAGFSVTVAPSAEAVLAGGAVSDIDCIVLDHRLPGMDGLGLLRRLRAEGLGCPAIIITTNPPRRLRRALEEEGVHLIEKPLLSDHLFATIATLTGRAQKVIQ